MYLELLFRDKRRRLCRAAAGIVAIAASVASVAASSAAAQPGLGIEHDPLECIPISDFAAFDAVLAPPEQVETCRLYFRSNISPDFYFVDMSVTLEDGLFRAYLPKPTSETSSVEYYLECLATDFANARTIGHEAEVVESADECRRRQPAAAYFLGDDPAIVVGSLNPAASLSPPAGFSLEGLAASSSGLSRGVIVAAVGGAAAAGITGGVIASGDEPPAPLPLAPAPPPPPVGGGPPPAPTPIRACFETSPSSGMVAAGESIGLDASCSTPSDLIYSWELGDGRTRSGVFIRPVFREEGAFEVKLSVRSMTDPSQSDETTMPVSVERAVADLQVEKFARAVCGGETENVEVRVKVTNNGPNTADNVVLTDSVPGGYVISSKPSRCDEVGGDLSCRLGDMESGEMQELIYVLAFGFIVDESGLRRLAPFPAARVSSDTSDPGIGNNESVVDFGTLTCFSEGLRVGPSPVELQTALEGAGNGRIQVNGRQSVAIPGGAQLRARLQGVRGSNRVEARIIGEAHHGGTWRFGFAQSPGFVPGTLRVESGDVLAIGPDAVTFRIGTGVGPPIRFNFQLER